MQRFIRMFAALAVFMIATGLVPAPKVQVAPLVPSVQTAAAIDLCSIDPLAPGCPGADPCLMNPTAAGCPGDPCSLDPTSPGCPNDPCVIDPSSFECTGDLCSLDPTSPGCPNDPCVIDPASYECTGDLCSLDPTSPGCPNDPCVIDPSSFECTGDPCSADPTVPGCPGDPCLDPTSPGCPGDPCLDSTSPGCPDEPGTIFITPTASGDTGTQFFTFDLDDGQDVSSGHRNDLQSLSSVPPGTHTITDTPPAGWVLDTVTCGDTPVTPTGQSFTVSLAAGGEVSCVVTHTRSLTITKSVEFVSSCKVCAEGQSAVYYSIDIVNSGPAVDDVTLLETPTLPAHTSVVSTDWFQQDEATGDPSAGFEFNPLWNGGTQPMLTASPVTVPAGAHWTLWAETFVVVDSATTIAETTCPTNGVHNTVTIMRAGEEQQHASACADMIGEVQFDKTVADHTYDPESGEFTITYDLSATNISPVPTTFSLTDTPAFSPSVTVTSATVTDQSAEMTTDLDISSPPVTIATDVPLGGGAERHYLVAISYTIDPSSDPTAVDRVCNDAAGWGLFNSAIGTYAVATETSGDSTVGACANVPAPNLQFDKQLAGVTAVDGDTLRASFDLTVSDLPVDGMLAAPANYQFIDLPVETPGIMPVAFDLDGVDGAVVGMDYEASIEPFLNGVDVLSVIGTVEPGATHVYHVSVDYDFDLVDGFSGACGPVQVDEQPPGGMFNVLVTDIGGFFGGDYEINPDTGLPFGFYAACADAAAVTFDKTVINDDGGSLQPGDFVFDVLDEADAVVQTGHHDDTVVVPAGPYTVTEEPTPGYVSSGVTCESLDGVGGAAVSGTTFFEAGGHYLCSATNNDEAIDLAITLSDGDDHFVAGGAPVTYTVTVTNHGRPVPDGGLVSVDLAMSETQFIVDDSVGCVRTWVATNGFGCDLDPTGLGTGESLVFTFQATVPADGASGIHWVGSSVTTEGDPGGQAALCGVSRPAGVDSNGVNPHGADNVACDTTPVTREATMSATKVSDATGPKTAGDLVTYTLTTTNHGPSTILSGTTLTDDLPLGVELVSVTAPGWLCNNADPVVCEYDQSIGVDETAPAVQIVTKVTATGSGTISNTGAFVGILDVEQDVPIDGLHSAATPVIVTATATASAVASITITQSGAGGGGGGGGLPVTGGSPLALLTTALCLLGVGVVLVRVRRTRLLRHDLG